MTTTFSRNRLRLLPVAVAAVLIAAMAQLPVLRNPRFYFTDDSAAQFLPTWHYLGDLLRAGQFPLMEPSAWAGGNFAAEALFGLYNPLLLANMVLVSAIPSLVVGSVLVKTEFLVILGLGVYGLAREYGVPRWFAVVPAVSVPFAGVTLYFDASSWASGLLAFAFVPHFWWTLRRSARGALNPLVPFAAGYLTITAGNPYGVLGACVVVLSLAAEFAICRRWPALRRAVVSGIAVGLIVPLVYLPLVLTQPVTYRNGAGVSNNGLMVPGLGDLINASTPSFNAWIHAFEQSYLTVPATYIAWYLVPLLPWLRYDRLRRRLPALSGLLVYAVIALGFSTGPSDAWMFRWPLRVVPYLVLPVVVLAAVALSAGLDKRQPWRRAAASAVLVLGGAFLAFSARPNLWRIHLVSLALVALLVAVLVLAYRSARRRAAPVAVLVAGCVAVLAFHVGAFPRNLNFTDYEWPESVPSASAALEPRYPGTVLEVASNGAIQHSTDPGRRFAELMFGNMLHAIGVESVNTYYGMGFLAFTNALCIEYNGSVCPEALARVWQPPAPGWPPLADLLRLDTVVVQNDLPGVAGVAVPAGWRIGSRSDVATVLRREQPLPYADGRLAHAPQGVVVIRDVATARTEDVEVAGGPGGTLTFARLAWPGYTAQFNGAPIPVRQGPAGLLTVELPPGAAGRLSLAWSPPGLLVGVLAAALGAALALAQTVGRWVRRRRSAGPDPGLLLRDDQPAGDVDHDAGAEAEQYGGYQRDPQQRGVYAE